MAQRSGMEYSYQWLREVGSDINKANGFRWNKNEKAYGKSAQETVQSIAELMVKKKVSRHRQPPSVDEVIAQFDSLSGINTIR